jgi:hypothetical protein
MSTIQEIRLSNNGPVKLARFPAPERGGLVVLKGRNGIGKTQSLGAIEYAVTGRGEPPKVTDGELRGEIELFGLTITLGRRTTRSGELEVESLDGKLSLSDLIDPGIKSPEAADAKRIKALVAIHNTLPSAELFYSLLGGREQFESVVGSAALASDDLVTMAERIKRDCEAKARQEESQAEHAEGRARGAREATAGVDVKVETDAVKLQGELEAAIRDESSLQAQQHSASKAALAAKQAKDALDDAEVAYSGPTLIAAQEAEATAKANVDRAEATLRAAEEALRKAQSLHAETRSIYSQAISARKSAESHENTLKQWREQIAASIPVAPTPEQLAAAAQRVTDARLANDRGVLARKAIQQLAEGDKHAEAAGAHRKRAAQLRDAAHGTDEVLSEVIAKSGSQLRVEQGRLVLDTRRGKTFFHDLSAGERSRIVVDIGIEAAGGSETAKRAVFVLSQEIFEGLDPQNRDALKQHAEEREVLIYTAEASEDEEISAEVYGAN